MFHYVNRLAQVIKLMVSVGILLSYPLQFFVGVQIMWSAIEERHGPLKHPYQTQLLFRAFLVLFTCKYQIHTKQTMRSI